jgi:hypothetical protein
VHVLRGDAGKTRWAPSAAARPRSRRPRRRARVGRSGRARVDAELTLRRGARRPNAND